jgi:hypothetical protein
MKMKFKKKSLKLTNADQNTCITIYFLKATSFFETDQVIKISFITFSVYLNAKDIIVSKLIGCQSRYISFIDSKLKTWYIYDNHVNVTKTLKCNSLPISARHILQNFTT